MVESIVSRTLCYMTEVIERVEQAIRNTIPEKYRKELEIKHTKVTGHYNDKIIIMETELRKKKMVKESFSYIIDSLNDSDLKWLRRNLDTIIDEKGFLYLRLSKQRAYENVVKLAKDNDIIRIKIGFRQYPRNNLQDIKQFILNKIEMRLKNQSGSDLNN